MKKKLEPQKKRASDTSNIWVDKIAVSTTEPPFTLDWEAIIPLYGKENVEDNVDLLTPEQTCAYLGIQMQTLYNWVSMKKIDYYKVGKKTVFTKEFIDCYLKKHYIKAVDTIDSDE